LNIAAQINIAPSAAMVFGAVIIWLAAVRIFVLSLVVSKLIAFVFFVYNGFGLVFFFPW
jgi:hypothetical protein